MRSKLTMLKQERRHLLKEIDNLAKSTGKIKFWKLQNRSCRLRKKYAFLLPLDCFIFLINYTVFSVFHERLR